MAKKVSLKKILSSLAITASSLAVLSLPIAMVSCAAVEKTREEKETNEKNKKNHQSNDDTNQSTQDKPLIIKDKENQSKKTEKPNSDESFSPTNPSSTQTKPKDEKKTDSSSSINNPEIKSQPTVVIPVATNNIQSLNIPGKPSITKPVLKQSNNLILTTSDLRNTNYDTQMYLNEKSLLHNDANRAVFEVKNKNQYPSEVTKNQIIWFNKNIQFDATNLRNYQYEISDALEYDNELGYIGFYYRIYLKAYGVEFSTPWLFTKLYGFKSLLNSHYLKSLKQLKTLSSQEVINNSELNQKLLTNFNNFLENYQNDTMTTKGIDFINYFAERDDGQTLRDFSSEVSSIGYYGNFGSTGLEKIKYSPTHVFNNRASMNQNYVALVDSSKVLQAVSLDVKNTQLLELIKNNPFGYLASNLSQLFYYLDYQFISSVFKINNVTEVQMNYNDEKAEGLILLRTQDNQFFKLVINKTNTDNLLKNVTDFYQYQYDRSFFFDIRFFRPYTDKNPSSMRIGESSFGGTGWVFDRVKNPILEQENQKELNKDNRKYEFLVASNLHVLDLSSIYDKYYNTSLYAANNVYNAFWNSGLEEINFSKQSKPLKTLDFNVKRSKNGKQTTKVSVLDVNNPYNNPYIKQIKAPVYLSKPKTKNVSEATQRGSTTFLSNNYHVESSINSKNYLDIIWYTPRYRAENLRSFKGNEYNQIFTQENYQDNQIGSIDNGGADIAFTKLVISGRDVKQLFPSLYEILDTPDETTWYSGLGTSKLVSSNDTLFLAGFPGTTWDNIYTNAGVMETKVRQIDLSYFQSAWQKYDKKLNEQFNNTINPVRYERYEVNWTNLNYIQNQINKIQLVDNQSPLDVTNFNTFKNNLNKYTPINQQRGMSVPSALTNASLAVKKNFLTAQEKDNHKENYLQGGASGSMVINSKFEVVGLVYKLLHGNYSIIDNDDIYETGNAVSLLTTPQISDNINWNGSIKDDVINKLISENTYTYLLNPLKK